MTTMDLDSYSYDENGNQTSRNIGGSVYTLTYDQENRLVGVSGAATATFLYDGDGNRVKGEIIGGATTTYIGNYAEWISGSPGSLVKYYYAGATRVAMISNDLYYLLGDHLGSTSVTANSLGVKSAEVRYYPWGTERYTYSSTPTTFRFTGQRYESGIELYFYNARFYDPAAGRFIQADTIVPGVGNSQAYDRYVYVNNNPVKYTDPSGHLSCSANHVAEGDCSDYTTLQLLEELYGVTLKDGSGANFTVQEISAIYSAVQAVGTKFSQSMGGGLTSGEAFKSIYGTMEFEMWDGQCGKSCWGRSLGANKIRFYRHYTDKTGKYILDTKISEQLAVHELGHSFENAITPTGGKPPNSVLSSDMTGNRNGLKGPLWTWQQSEDITSKEIYADMFLGWVYDMWYSGNNQALFDAGVDRMNFMNLYMPIWLNKN